MRNFSGSRPTRAEYPRQFEIRNRYGMLPPGPTSKAARRKHITEVRRVGACRDGPRDESAGVAKVSRVLSKPEVQGEWLSKNPDILPLTRAGVRSARAQGVYDRNPGARISIEQMTLKPRPRIPRGRGPDRSCDQRWNRRRTNRRSGKEIRTGGGAREFRQERGQTRACCARSSRSNPDRSRCLLEEDS